MKYLIAATLALIAVPSLGHARAHDGFSFGKREYTRLAPVIEFHEYATTDEIATTIPVANLISVQRKGGVIMAYSVLNGNRCVVHFVKPEYSYQPEWVGHEIFHCLYGRWHR